MPKLKLESTYRQRQMPKLKLGPTYYVRGKLGPEPTAYSARNVSTGSMAAMRRAGK